MLNHMTEHYFNRLESHRIYQLVDSLEALQVFLSQHFICAWSYNALLLSLFRDLSCIAVPLHSSRDRSILFSINKLFSTKELEADFDGQKHSNFETYLAGMSSVGCEVPKILPFLAQLSHGVDLDEALLDCDLPAGVVDYARMTSNLLKAPLHHRAAALFYEGEPYIPDQFVDQLKALAKRYAINDVVHYFKRHIEGLNNPGISMAGRLVEAICEDDLENKSEAERTAQKVMLQRLLLWNALSEEILNYCGRHSISTREAARIVRPLPL